GGDEQLALLGIGEGVLWISLRRSRKFIASELFRDKPVKRFVGIKGTDDVIAIFVCVTARRIGVAVAIRVGIACDVEPVAAPAFAVMRGIEQTIEQLFVRAGRGVREEGFDLGGRWRQPGDIKAGASEPGDLST